jgi:hypothetical protein
MELILFEFALQTAGAATVTKVADSDDDDDEYGVPTKVSFGMDVDRTINNLSVSLQTEMLSTATAKAESDDDDEDYGAPTKVSLRDWGRDRTINLHFFSRRSCGQQQHRSRKSTTMMRNMELLRA